MEEKFLIQSSINYLECTDVYTQRVKNPLDAPLIPAKPRLPGSCISKHSGQKGWEEEVKDITA